MFDIGFPELMLVALVGLLVIGPERLPEALRTLGLWLGRMRRSFLSVKAEIEKEIGMDEVRKQLHNEAVMEEMKRIEREGEGDHQCGRRGFPHRIHRSRTRRRPRMPSPRNRSRVRRSRRINRRSNRPSQTVADGARPPPHKNVAKRRTFDPLDNVVR